MGGSDCHVHHLQRRPDFHRFRSVRLPSSRRRHSSRIADERLRTATFRSYSRSKGKSFAKDARLILLTSEGGSITLRTESDEGMFGHHGSKAAANMVGKLLSSSLKKEGVIVGMAHPGFLKSGA